MTAIYAATPAAPDTADLRSRVHDVTSTNKDLRCLFQIVKKHYSRYTQEMVERVTGVPQDVFQKIAQTITDNSGPERTGVISYAVGRTQHTYGPQMISTAALLQLLLGNIGR